MKTEKTIIGCVFFALAGKADISFHINNETEIKGLMEKLGSSDGDYCLVRVAGYDIPFALPYGTEVTMYIPEAGDESNPIMLGTSSYEPKYLGKWVIMSYKSSPRGRSATKTGQLSSYEAHHKRVMQDGEEKVVISQTWIFKGGEMITLNDVV